MSQKVTVQEGPYITLTEAVAGALTGKDDQLLSLNNAGKAVLFDGTAPAFAVMVEKPWPDSNEVKARMLGKGGTVRVIQHVALDIGARVQGRGANARVEALAVGGRSLGFKVGPTSGGAAGNVIEVADLIESAAVASVVAAPAAAVNVNGAIAALNSTAVNPTKADFDAALAALEVLADDVRASIAKQTEIHTALVAQGILKIA